MSARTIVRVEPKRAVQFVCPKCGGDRAGDVMHQRRWLALFGRPIAPLAELDDAVRCRTCAYTSDLGVLDIPTTDQLETMLFNATVSAAVLAIRASSGEHQNDVTQRAVETIAAAGFVVGARELADDVATLRHEDAIAQLRLLRGDLTQFGKQGFLHRIGSVIMTGCSMTPQQRDVLYEIGASIGLSPPHVNGIIAVASVHSPA